MSITAKELATLLHLSESAVSLALNHKKGVSTKTRNKVIEAAHNYGYDFSKIKHQPAQQGSINLLIYRKNGVVVTDTPFFDELINGVQKACKDLGYPLTVRYLLSSEPVELQLKTTLSSDCIGILLIGTEMQQEELTKVTQLKLPVVLLDSSFHNAKIDCVQINNVEGAFEATLHLIKHTQSQPGYLKSSYSINNFEERSDRFFKAIRSSGMSTNACIVHELSPSIDGACADMNKILENKEPLAKCYFADNDLIAVGAMQALKEHGKRIPQDISIIGFDNMPICTYLDPPLTTVNVPKEYMGIIAVERLVSILKTACFLPVKFEVNTEIITRSSVTEHPYPAHLKS